MKIMHFWCDFVLDIMSGFGRVVLLERKGNQMKCECDQNAKVPTSMLHMYDAKTERPFANHKPNECLCTNDLRQYHRSDGSTKWLCSCCHIPSDREVQ